MSRIAGEFCTWLRDLPGEDTKVPHLCTQALGSHAYLPCYVHLCHHHLAFYPTHIHIRFELFNFKPSQPLYRPVAPPKAHRYLDVVYHHLHLPDAEGEPPGGGSPSSSSSSPSSPSSSSSSWCWRWTGWARITSELFLTRRSRQTQETPS